MIANRAVRWMLGLGLALLALTIALAWPGWQSRADQAAGMGARIGCSCRYIEGRALSGCRQDLSGVPWMGMVRYAEDPQARRVTAHVPLLAKRAAHFRPGHGCMIEPR